MIRETGNPFILYCKVANLTPSFRRKRMQIKLKHLLKLKIIIYDDFKDKEKHKQILDVNQNNEPKFKFFTDM
jgi:hypothetical protein